MIASTHMDMKYHAETVEVVLAKLANFGQLSLISDPHIFKKH